MIKIKEKKERALGIKLLLKPERCVSSKCAAVRRPYRPGAHGKARRRRISEMAEQLLEKQKFQYSYGLKEGQVRKIFEKAMVTPGKTVRVIAGLLERRLDNVLYRLGLAPSRSVARQLVSHCHILVNNRRVNIPSFLVKTGDAVTIRPQSRSLPVFDGLSLGLQKYEPPSWLSLDKEKLMGLVLNLPSELDSPFDINMVVDYYKK